MSEISETKRTNYRVQPVQAVQTDQIKMKNELKFAHIE